MDTSVSEQASPEQSASEQTVPEQPTSDQVVSNMPTLKQPVPEQPTSEQSTSEQAASENLPSEQAVPEQPTSGQLTSDKPSSEEPASASSASEQSFLHGLSRNARFGILGAAVLAALLLGLAAFTQAGSGATQGSSASGASSSDATTHSSTDTTEASQSSSSAKGNSSSSAVSASAAKALTYKVGEDGQLRFVDKENLAHTFDEYATLDGLPIVAPSISAGTFVDAFSQTDSHKIDGREYRDLDNKYLNTLKADVEAYRQNPQTSFKAAQNERLQIPMDEYNVFVALLSNSDVLDQVAQLTLVADGMQVASDTSTTYAGPTVPSGATRAAEAAAAQRDAEETDTSDISAEGTYTDGAYTEGVYTETAATDYTTVPEETDASGDGLPEVLPDAYDEGDQDTASAEYAYEIHYGTYAQSDEGAYENTYTDYTGGYGISDSTESLAADAQ